MAISADERRALRNERRHAQSAICDCRDEETRAGCSAAALLRALKQGRCALACAAQRRPAQPALRAQKRIDSTALAAKYSRVNATAAASSKPLQVYTTIEKKRAEDHT